MEEREMTQGITFSAIALLSYCEFWISPWMAISTGGFNIAGASTGDGFYQAFGFFLAVRTPFFLSSLSNSLTGINIASLFSRFFGLSASARRQPLPRRVRALEDLRLLICKCSGISIVYGGGYASGWKICAGDPACVCLQSR